MAGGQLLEKRARSVHLRPNAEKKSSLHSKGGYSKKGKRPKIFPGGTIQVKKGVGQYQNTCKGGALMWDGVERERFRR